MSGGLGNLIKTLQIDTRLLGMIGAFIAISLVFHVATGGSFLPPRNLFTLTLQTASVAVMATGMVFVIVTRNIDQATETELRDLSLDRRPILAMAHHAASGQLAVGDGEGYIMMISTSDWRITHDFRAARQGPVWALAFSPDGETIYAGGLDDAIYAWPVDLLDRFDAAIDGERSFLRDVETMSNGERQFMRKCSICHALEDGPSRKAGPTLYGVFGRTAGAVPGYRYSDTLDGSAIIWDDETIDALFDIGPDHYIPGSKMPMQVIAKPGDRADLIAYLKEATTGN